MRFARTMLSRFSEIDNTRAGALPRKSHVTRCRPAVAGPFSVLTVSPRASVMTIFACSRGARPPRPLVVVDPFASLAFPACAAAAAALPVMRYTISAPYCGLGALKNF